MGSRSNAMSKLAAALVPCGTSLTTLTRSGNRVSTATRTLGGSLYQTHKDNKTGKISESYTPGSMKSFFGVPSEWLNSYYCNPQPQHHCYNLIHDDQPTTRYIEEKREYSSSRISSSDASEIRRLQEEVSDLATDLDVKIIEQVYEPPDNISRDRHSIIKSVLISERNTLRDKKREKRRGNTKPLTEERVLELSTQALEKVLDKREKARGERAGGAHKLEDAVTWGDLRNLNEGKDHLQLEYKKHMEEEKPKSDIEEVKDLLKELLSEKRGKAAPRRKKVRSDEEEDEEEEEEATPRRRRAKKDSDDEDMEERLEAIEKNLLSITDALKSLKKKKHGGSTPFYSSSPEPDMDNPEVIDMLANYDSITGNPGPTHKIERE